MKAPSRSSIVIMVLLLAVTSAAAARQRRDSASKSGTAEPPVTFENIGPRVGLDFEHRNGASPDKFLAETMGSGGLFFDYNNDNRADAFLVDGGSIADRQAAGRARHRLYRNRQDGTFEDVTAASGIRHREYGMGACAADYDNDGWTDLYVTNFGSNILYRNKGDGSFADVTSSSGVGLSSWSTSCAFVDIERDGDLDLFVTNYVDARVDNNKFCGKPTERIRIYCHPLNYQGRANVLYRNDGKGGFADVSADSGIAKYKGNGLGVAIGDYDDDGSPDVFVANDAVPNFLFHNEGNGKFREVALLAGVAVASDGKARAGMGTDFGDYDGDGRLDLFVTNHEFETHTLFRNLGNGLFADVTAESGIGPSTLPLVGFGTVFFDHDNDGALDIVIVNGHVVDNTAMFRSGSTHAQRKLLLRNQGNRRFVEIGALSGSGFALQKVGRTAVAADVDTDGDLDLLVTNNGQTPDLLRNDGGNRGNALVVRTIGRKSNRDGIGTRLRLTSGTMTQVREVKSGSSYLGQNDLRPHFGLGRVDKIDRLELRWPSGQMETVRDVPVNHVITVVEGQGVTERTRFVR
ncbi:MAG TPA: CRTAC1 family protein [Vicinamibacterales bacterium]